MELIELLKLAVSQVMDLELSKNQAYWERNQLVKFLTKIFPSHLMLHEDKPGEEWENDWRHIVCIHSPRGQLTWHIHDSDVLYFTHLDILPENHWDGHTNDEKYARLDLISIEDIALLFKPLEK